VHGQEHQSIPCMLLEYHGSRHGGESGVCCLDLGFL
jgi:hypothetical protein